MSILDKVNQELIKENAEKNKEEIKEALKEEKLANTQINNDNKKSDNNLESLILSVLIILLVLFTMFVTFAVTKAYYENDSQKVILIHKDGHKKDYNKHYDGENNQEYDYNNPKEIRPDKLHPDSAPYLDEEQKNKLKEEYDKLYP